MAQIYVCKGSQSEVEGVPLVVKLLPLGHVTSQKGNFEVDEESFSMIKAKFLSHGIDIVVDYEHQTLGGTEAPAGGWIKDLFLKDSTISAKIEWTPKAQKYLENKEYRYLSPVVIVRKSDNKAICLHSVALTNTPAINDMFPIINSADLKQYETKGDESMDIIKKLALLLGLEEDATAEQVLEKLQTSLGEIETLKAEIKKYREAGTSSEIVANKTICGLLGVDSNAKTEDVAAAILSLKSSSNMEAEFKALKAKLDLREADDVVLKALKSGKLSAIQKDWATEYALKDPNGFAKFIDKAPIGVPMGELEFEIKANKSGFDDETIMKVCKQLGVSKDDYEKFGKDSE